MNEFINFRVESVAVQSILDIRSCSGQSGARLFVATLTSALYLLIVKRLHIRTRMCVRNEYIPVFMVYVQDLQTVLLSS